MVNLFSPLKQLWPCHLCLAITYLVTGLFIVMIQVTMTLLIKPFSPNSHRRLNYYVTYLWNCQLVFLVEWWSGTRCILYADPITQKYFGKERMHIVANHTYEMDWLMAWLFLDRIQLLGHAKIYMKKMLQFIPIMGWSWKLQEIIFLERDWTKDKTNLEVQLTNLQKYPVPYTLTLFPEGTRFTPEKHKVSMQVAKSKGLPTLKHLLLPRTRGFVASMTHMRKCIEQKDYLNFSCVYDVTIAFNPKLGEAPPTINSMLNGEKIVGHMLIRRIPLEEIPENEEMAAEWLHELFRQKDVCLDNFFREGDFNPKGDLKDYTNFQYFELPRRLWSLGVTSVASFLVLGPILSKFWGVLTCGSYVEGGVVIGVILGVHLAVKKIINFTQIDKGSNYGTNKNE